MILRRRARPGLLIASALITFSLATLAPSASAQSVSATPTPVQSPARATAVVAIGGATALPANSESVEVAGATVLPPSGEPVAPDQSPLVAFFLVLSGLGVLLRVFTFRHL